jgi:DNA-binding HxlR family transcriptional regulator
MGIAVSGGGVTARPGNGRPARRFRPRPGPAASLLALHGHCQRFAALRRQIEGINQKMLTQTLRRLEHDGLVNRRAFATVPVTVEYSLTPLGESLCEVIETLRTWAYSHAGDLTAAHRKYVTENG